ncbi:MAG: hypothetical protein AAB263_00900 [Planctomycetota bacterium]
MSACTRLKRVTLELGLKVFTRLDDAFIEQQCRLAFDNWRRLIEDAEKVTVLLWIGDGDDVFTWRGDLNDEIRWCTTIGFNNQKYDAYPPCRHYLTSPAKPYIEKPPRVTYGDLKRIVAALKTTAKSMYGIRVYVGATVDAGPEFVESAFKFEKHPELLEGGPKSAFPKTMAFLCCYGLMKADHERYAGFPNGIPEGTPFGTFLGRQFNDIAQVLGYDYIWLSNGFGLTHYAWSYLGEVFDGRKFAPDLAAQRVPEFLSFWKAFRAECPHLPIEIRGTNFSIGMDAAAHGIDVRAIYDEGHLQRPAPNPPWGSNNLGLEMAAYLSRISCTPERGFPFRFYVCDNWFSGVPWRDYYNREPFDMYCPMAAARLSPVGAAEAATDVLLLTINSGVGELNKTHATEIEPHIRRAFTLAPDEAGPLVWVYPFAEYQDEIYKPNGRLVKSFFGDWFIARAIAGGLPLNTVIETKAFTACVAKHPKTLGGRILVVPTPTKDWSYVGAVLEHVQRGGKAVFYGSLHEAPPELLKALNISITAPIDGDLTVSLNMTEDHFAVTPHKRPLRHIARNCDGGVCEELDKKSDAGTHVRATVSRGGKRRVYALVRTQRSWKGGSLAWIRGSLPFDAAPDSLEPVMFPPAESHDASIWLRYLLADFGLNLRQDRHDITTKPVYMFASRTRGGFVFNGHKPDATVVYHLEFPDGAPICCERQTIVQGSVATYYFDRSFNLECQAFVRQKTQTVVGHKEESIVNQMIRRFRITGLKDAAVALYVPRTAIENKTLVVESVVDYVVQDPTVDAVPRGKRGKPRPPEKKLTYQVDPVTGAALLKGITGSIRVTY